MESGNAIQIIAPLNHEYEIRFDKFKHILEDDHIKDRKVVIISIAGALRKGKSFLLNFFLKYLYAQVGITKEKLHSFDDLLSFISTSLKDMM